jgi:hypothetical protein
MTVRARALPDSSTHVFPLPGKVRDCRRTVAPRSRMARGLVCHYL